MADGFISRSKHIAIQRALLKMAAEQIRQATTSEEFAHELAAAAETGGLEAVRAVLEAKRAELSASVDDLVAAAIAEIRADED